MKVCTLCKEEKELNEFYDRKGSMDGKHYYCKECSRKRRRELYYDKKQGAKELILVNDFDDIKKRIEQEIARRKIRKNESALMVIIRDDWTCQECGEKVNLYRDSNTHSACIDHIIPLDYGGLDIWENQQTLCRGCHEVKQTKIKATFK